MLCPESTEPCWSVAVFSSREAPARLLRALDAVLRALGTRRAVVDIVINGNPSLALAMRSELSARTAFAHTRLRLWQIALGDKANAWNEYLEKIWSGSSLAFFVDGYAEVYDDAFEAIAADLDANAKALAASGVPSVGRSAVAQRAQMLAEGGIHGNLYAVKGTTMEGLRQSGFRLPLGIYRTDPTLQAVLWLALDPPRQDWVRERVIACAGASWRNDVLSPWNPGHWRVHWRRKLRQAQGVLETQAVRNFLQKRALPVACMPRSVDELVREWAEQNPRGLRRILVKQPLCIPAWLTLRRRRDWGAAQRLPELLWNAEP